MIRDPFKVWIDGYRFEMQPTGHWVQVSITTTSGTTHYMRLSLEDGADLGEYLREALSAPLTGLVREGGK